MFRTVYVDNGDHLQVIADYSGSPRHARLTEVQWREEYARDPAYMPMRLRNPKSVAGITPHGCGKWLPDWSGPYEEPVVKLALSAAAPSDFDGVPAVPADGAAKHIVSIQQKDELGLDAVAGPGPLRILLSAGTPVSNRTPTLTSGRAQVEIGPVTQGFDLEVTVVDPAGTMEPGKLKIRFR